MIQPVTMACGQRAEIQSVYWENSVIFASRHGFLEGSMFNLNRFIIKHAMNAVRSIWQMDSTVLILPNGWIVGDPQRPSCASE